MPAGMLALALGLVLPRFLPVLLPVWLVWALLAAGVLILPLGLKRLSLVIIGLGWACLNAHWALADRLAPELDGRTVWLEGEVVGLPEWSLEVSRFELTSLRSRHAGLPERVRLAWYGGPRLHAGERWRLAARLKRPHGSVNPQSFDYEAWLLSRHVGATGSIKAGERMTAAAGVGTWRDALRNRLLEVEAHGRSGAIAALVLGDDSGLSSADWSVLQATGTVHLLVISGQHVALLAGLLYLVVSGLARWGLWPSAVPWLPAACGCAALGAFGYGALAGFDVPVQRACLMVLMILLWRLCFRHLGAWVPLIMAMVAVLVVEPLASLKPGFWLSFGAVGLLIFAFSGRLGRSPAWQTLFRVQWVMTLGLLPLMLAMGLPISISGPLANLIAVPFVSAIAVPLSLLGTTLLPVPVVGEFLLSLAGLSLEWLFRWLGMLAAWQPVWHPQTLPVPSLLAVGLGALLLLVPRGVPVRLAGLPLVLVPLLFGGRSEPLSGQADVWVFDVGQGLSVLVRTQNHALLYDAGPRHGEFDSGERLIVPSLGALGVRHLDRLLISHADNDHAGGAVAVARALPVSRVMSGEPGELMPSLGAEPCEATTWEWDGVRFATWQSDRPESGNGASCLLMIEAQDERMLLTGDIDRRTEARLLDSGWPVRAEWLVLPHHGSGGSSSASFIDAVQPHSALVSRGLHNPFGHPDEAVVRRLDRDSIGLHDTARHGAIHVRLGMRQPATHLRDERRFWREK